MQTDVPVTDRTRVRREPARGRYDRETVHGIIDAALLCHVAFRDGDSVFCIPTVCWREDGHLYIHGSNGSRMLRALLGGQQACVTVTHLDGLVLARAAFNHSMNYRSVVVLGAFEAVPDDRKAASLDRLMDHLAPGRKHEARPGDANELRSTTVLRIALDEASAKLRTGGPQDDEADLSLDVWAGVLPLAVHALPPVPEPGITRSMPDGLRKWAGA
ncbi:pyridoxamine 5'-phosphate oxidase family protein [Schlegelella sp. S2-27]|uniref:Pyridoxamine 5'-phosphate oxidase family protein n=1 Tax=Caldimonas mangrovi TaxID=2944811 RepID=A0ABT0YU95_9BURK|nr:pyridoxamine 5'-phosphate oxidase family protein [Caldimonas mangrovi]MCM5682326.1 pyridoxamine 5'-phosphate oxidase family protein [Caldimonas mangrovi]